LFRDAIDATSLATRLELVLARSRHACVRLTETHLAVGDDRGRVIVVELAHGRVVRDLRV
jgi:hypothetical protein